MGKKEDNMNNFMPINFKTYKTQKNSLKNTTLKMLQEERENTNCTTPVKEIN